MILVIDNYDSFTYNLVQYLGELGADLQTYRNDKITVGEINKLAPEKILISPGPGYPKDAGISIQVIKEFAGKVPILGDIPLLGMLFKSSSKSANKTELLMFLTPHIVQAPAQLAALAGVEMRQTPVLTNSVTEQELDQYLERVPVKKKK